MVRRSLLRLFVASLGMLAALSTVNAALADQPVRAPLPNPPFEVTGFCSFPIDLAFPVNNEYTITFNDAAGNPVRTLIEGHLVATLTNAADPTRSVTVNISGPGEIDYNLNGSETITFLGDSGVFVLENGQQLFLLTSGRTVAVASSPTSLGSVLTAVGRAVNVCGLLS